MVIKVVDLILKTILFNKFVGSTPVAKYIYEASKNSKSTIIGGAKNHLGVMPDANLDQAIDGIIEQHMDQQGGVWQFHCCCC